jgi:hypothetical protein
MIKQKSMYKNASMHPVTKALHGFIVPLPAPTATTPAKNPLHNDLTSYYYVFSLSPLTIYLFKKKDNMALKLPDIKVFINANSA